MYDDGIKFTDYDFVRLFFAFLAYLDIKIISEENMNMAILDICKTDEYKAICSNIKIADDKYVCLKDAIDLAHITKLLNKNDDNTSELKIKINHPTMIIRLYSKRYTYLMIDFVKKYISAIGLDNKCNDLENIIYEDVKKVKVFLKNKF